MNITHTTRTHAHTNPHTQTHTERRLESQTSNKRKRDSIRQTYRYPILNLVYTIHGVHHRNLSDVAWKNQTPHGCAREYVSVRWMIRLSSAAGNSRFCVLVSVRHCSPTVGSFRIIKIYFMIRLDRIYTELNPMCVPSSFL